MCWICAHHVIEHGWAINEALDAKCGCLPEAIYPEKMIAARRSAAVGERSPGLESAGRP